MSDLLRVTMLTIGIYVLEFIFAAGVIGCAIVVVLVAIDDVKSIRAHNDNSSSIKGQSRSTAVHF